ncbi:glycoside hydrolase superfamily [Mycena rosella]|uniref:alpha-amylase n=1 Tax=Mycena rosella TaxID=1033263 RepID=A0AAD7DZ31_MYCRO|nr:glycoside hydrolase superfamily [Mycena rosella]
MFTSLSKFVLLSILSMDSAFIAAGSNVFRRAPSKGNNAIVQLFEWPWDSVAAECTSFLGPAGYGYVQVSPASEHITGSQWWTDYQTVSYKLTSKRGSRAQFANMVSTCVNAGVGVIVDVVFNHMTAGSGTGFAGSSYSKYNYPAVPYTSSNFHYCNGNSASNINNYDDAHNVQFCELVGLADLAQEQPAVQKIIAAFLNDLLSLGVAGFRIDAAKHMVDADIASIRALLTYPFYDTQEVIYGAGEAVQPSQYVTTGDVIEFRASSSAQAYFTGSSGIAALVTPTPMGAAWGFVDSSIANYIMANQDTERGGSSLNYQSPNNVYLLSGVFMLGFNYGTPTVYSGYNYSSYDAGAPQNSAGYTNAVTCSSNGWRCEHRWPALANMVAFYNAAGSAALTNVQKGTAQQISFGRGTVGFLVINNDGAVWTNTWNTSLAPGTYCDIVHDNTVDPSICNGPSYVVSASGTFSASVGPHDALALFTVSATNATNTSSMSANGSTTTTPFTTTASPTPTPVSTTVAITFVETASTGTADVIKVVGSIAQLGSWAPAAALALTRPSSTADWTLTLALPPGTYFEYKFIRVSSGGSVTWESGSNRVYSTPAAGSSVTLYGIFGSTTSSTSAVTAVTTSTTVVSTSSTPPSSSASSASSASLSSVTSSPPTSSPSSSSSAPSSTSATSSSSTLSPPASSSSASSFSASSSAASSSASNSISTTFSSTTASPTPASTAVTVTFVETASTGTGDVIKVVGSIAQLGSWAPAAALALTQPSLNADWRLTLTLPPGTAFEYKFIRVSSGGSVTWESGSNRSYTTPPTAGSSVTLYGIFGSTTSSTSAVTVASTGNIVAPTPTTTSSSPPPVSTGASVTFSESATTASGEVIKLVGSIGQLGSWAPASAITLSNTNSVWSATLVFPPNTTFQYKFIRVKSGSVVWESDPNRSYTTLSQGSSVTLSSSFR